MELAFITTTVNTVQLKLGTTDRDTEKKEVFSSFFSVSLCLCGSKLQHSLALDQANVVETVDWKVVPHSKLDLAVLADHFAFDAHHVAVLEGCQA